MSRTRSRNTSSLNNSSSSASEDCAEGGSACQFCAGSLGSEARLAITLASAASTHSASLCAEAAGGGRSSAISSRSKPTCAQTGTASASCSGVIIAPSNIGASLTSCSKSPSASVSEAGAKVANTFSISAGSIRSSASGSASKSTISTVRG